LKIRTLVFAFLSVFFLTDCQWASSYASQNDAVEPGYKKSQGEKVDEDFTIDSQEYVHLSSRLFSADTLLPDSAKGCLPVPVCDAILPFKRVVAMYGNFYSPSMGILGSLKREELLQKLNEEMACWEKADSTTAALPAIHYIAVTAQRAPGKDKKYRLRMPGHQMWKAIHLGREAGGITFLDVQVGHSSVQEELPHLAELLSLPDVHLALDPEWSMRDGSIPGTKIGSMHAKDINYAIQFLATLVKKHHLPPKILVVHRFKNSMIEEYHTIQKSKHVQIVINMDGFGFPAKKKNSYMHAVGRNPIQFTGFKLFYKNDIQDPPYRMMTCEEVLQLHPKPVYIQYQ
jgi:hypothetical protein